MPEEPGENPEVKTLENRMTNLENALHQILDAEHRRCSSPIEPGRRVSGTPSGCGMGRSMGGMNSESEECNWALTAGEIDDFTDSQNNEERKYFNSLVNLMERE